MTTNEQRSEREVSEFLSHPPDEVFAYYSKDPAVGGHIGNWMGVKLGTITWVGKISRPMGGKVVSIRMKGINGLIYAGKCNLSSGTYCRLRRVAPKLYSERDSRSRDPESRRQPGRPGFYVQAPLSPHHEDITSQARWALGLGRETRYPENLETLHATLPSGMKVRLLRKPARSSRGAHRTSDRLQAYCEYCGKWFGTGNIDQHQIVHGVGSERQLQRYEHLKSKGYPASLKRHRERNPSASRDAFDRPSAERTALVKAVGLGPEKLVHYQISTKELRRMAKTGEKIRVGRDPGSRRGSSTSAQLNTNPLSGPRKDARDHAIAKAVAAARQSGEDYSVWMDEQGRFHVDQAGAAPWESTIAVAHETTGHLSYKRYESKARPRVPKIKSRGKRDASQGKLRRELGVIGNAIWHMPKSAGPWIIYWNGPGARLLFGSNRPGTTLDPIEYPGADGNYRTLKEATAAVARFWKKQ